MLLCTMITVAAQEQVRAMIQYNKGFEMYTEITFANFSFSGDTVTIIFKAHGKKHTSAAIIDTTEQYDTRTVYKLDNGGILRKYKDDGRMIYTSEKICKHKIENLLIITSPDTLNTDQ